MPLYIGAMSPAVEPNCPALAQRPQRGRSSPARLFAVFLGADGVPDTTHVEMPQ